MDARRVVGVALATVLLLLAGYGYSQRAGLQRQGTEMGHWLYDAAAWPAEISRAWIRTACCPAPRRITPQRPRRRKRRRRSSAGSSG